MLTVRAKLWRMTRRRNDGSWVNQVKISGDSQNTIKCMVGRKWRSTPPTVLMGCSPSKHSMRIANVKSNGGFRAKMATLVLTDTVFLPSPRLLIMNKLYLSFLPWFQDRWSQRTLQSRAGYHLVYSRTAKRGSTISTVSRAWGGLKVAEETAADTQWQCQRH